MNDREVDREKATVEDPPPSSVNHGEVDREKATVEDPPLAANAGQGELFSQHKWTVRLHIQGNPDRALIKGIPTESQCYEWNTPVTFGRGQDAKIFLNDERASRLHLYLTGQILSNADVCFTITNLSSTNGFSFNNHNIIANEQRINITSGDVIGISCLSFKVEIAPGQNMQNFVLEFVQPQESNAGVVGPPNNMVFMQAHVGPLSPGFQGQVFVPVAAVPAGVLPVNADTPWSRSGVGPAGYGGFNFPNPPIPVNSPPHRPVQEAEAPEQKRTGHKAVTKQPSENNEDSSSETAGDALQIPYGALKFFVDDQEKVNFVKMDDLHLLAQEAVGVWKNLGRVLGLPEFRITGIELDHKKHFEKCYQMLLTWVCMNPYNATYEALYRALDNPIVGRSDLAEKYCSTTKSENQTINKNKSNV